MNALQYDVVVIGGGPAGLAAAISAKNNGATVAIIERDFRLGGILEQCIHTGFGLKYFGEELAGPQYAHRFVRQVDKLGIDVHLNTMVLSIDRDPLSVYAVSKTGPVTFDAKTVILAMGCRERTRPAISLPGTRPAGIFTAGTAQRFVNIQNFLVGKEVVILGSGDIGMIMARRMTLEGATVKAVVEIMPYLAGLTRNKVQCLDDFGIPLYLGHTITSVRGFPRLTGVTIAKADDKMQAVPGTEFDLDCDTLLLSVGLIPENELSRAAGVGLDAITGGPVVDHMMQTDVPGIFACGNVVHVNDLVDNVSRESELAGKYAALLARGEIARDGGDIEVVPGENVRYVVPQHIDPKNTNGKVKLYFRVRNPDRYMRLCVKLDGREVFGKRRKIVNPGEIEEVELDTGAIAGAVGGSLDVSCVKDA